MRQYIFIHWNIFLYSNISGHNYFYLQNRTPSRLSSMFSGTLDKCSVCSKTVYPLEKVCNIRKLKSIVRLTIKIFIQTIDFKILTSLCQNAMMSSQLWLQRHQKFWCRDSDRSRRPYFTVFGLNQTNYTTFIFLNRCH